MSRPRTVTPGARDRQAVAAARLAAVQLDERCAGVPRLGEAVDQDGIGDRRQGRDQDDALNAVTRDGETDGDRSAVAAFELRIAWRSEPGPESAVLVTRKGPTGTARYNWDDLKVPADLPLKVSSVCH